MSMGETGALRMSRSGEYVGASSEFVTVFCVEPGFGRVNGWSISEPELACWLWRHGPRCGLHPV